MRPTPDEVAQGVSALLRASIDDPDAKRISIRMRSAAAVLRAFPWNDAAYQVHSENIRLQRAASLIAEWLEGHGLAGTLSEVAASDLDGEQPAPFCEANERNRRLRAFIVEALEAIPAPLLSESADLRKRLVELHLHPGFE